MIRLIILFSSVLMRAALFAEMTPEAIVMNNLIAITKKSVEMQEKIKMELATYQKYNLDFIQNPNDKELLFQTIKSADRLFRSINEAHLTDNFSPEFLNELTLFSQLAKKKIEK